MEQQGKWRRESSSGGFSSRSRWRWSRRRKRWTTRTRTTSSRWRGTRRRRRRSDDLGNCSSSSNGTKWPRTPAWVKRREIGTFCSCGPSNSSVVSARLNAPTSSRLTWPRAQVARQLASETLDTLLSIAGSGTQRRPSLGSNTGVASYPPIPFVDDLGSSSRSSDAGSETFTPWGFSGPEGNSTRKSKWMEALSETNKAEREARTRQNLWQAIKATTKQSSTRSPGHHPKIPSRQETQQLPVLKPRAVYSARPVDEPGVLSQKGSSTVRIDLTVFSFNSDSVLKISRVAKGVEIKDSGRVRAELVRRQYENRRDGHQAVSGESLENLVAEAALLYPGYTPDRAREEDRSDGRARLLLSESLDLLSSVLLCSSHGMASHRIASHRIASHRIASHPIASHLTQCRHAWLSLFLQHTHTYS